MKTRAHFMIVTGLYLTLSLTLLSNVLVAQTIICTDTAPENMIIMKIDGALPEASPDKLVLQFDNASLSFEFDMVGELALVCASAGGAANLSLYSFANLYEVSVEEEMELESWMTEPFIANDISREEKMALEDWMMNPKGWNR